MSPSRILVVDDEPSVTGALELILTELGHHVDTALRISEATEFLKGSPYDLVFTDLRLPDGSGIDLLSLIKTDTPDTQVIVMTAHGSLDITIEAIDVPIKRLRDGPNQWPVRQDRTAFLTAPLGRILSALHSRIVLFNLL